jgi:hypothetical protein
VFDPSTIDIVAMSDDHSSVALFIVQSRPWTGSDSEIESLRQKVRNYMAYAVEGQLADDYPGAAGLPWRIVVHCGSGLPDERTDAILQGFADVVRRYGGDLVVTEDTYGLEPR